MAPELFQDAATLEETLSQQGGETAWQEWPLVVGDGDIAALIELVSDGKVHIKFKYSKRSADLPLARIQRRHIPCSVGPAYY